MLVKTGIYSCNLKFSVDNLCNCVEKPDNKSVLSFHLLEGLSINKLLPLRRFKFLFLFRFGESFRQPLLCRHLRIQPTQQ